VLPCQFQNGMSAQSLHLDGSEQFDILGINDQIAPQQKVSLAIRRSGGSVDTVPIQLRIDTPIEIDYYRHGGILPFVLRQLLG
jgi:aconitate hydratase